MQLYEIYRDLFGAWTPETTSFTNRHTGHTAKGPYERTLLVPGGAITLGREWYSVIPFDYS